MAGWRRRRLLRGPATLARDRLGPSGPRKQRGKSLHVHETEQYLASEGRLGRDLGWVLGRAGAARLRPDVPRAGVYRLATRRMSGDREGALLLRWVVEA
ncbi:hypothetical protein NDU88_001428 [Pleurodeles waltl]|uniref:Uncharacterized protein n=1 Tax=Pleurodeles waltl TaxID=8319 RepID=A0AAV7RAT7_PLEWA|nr:hypothetical protein NDU88_001428 [Pleurodeles waltl]